MKLIFLKDDLKNEKTFSFSKYLSLFKPFLALKTPKIYELFISCCEVRTQILVFIVKF